ncbi:Protein asteroid [Schistosoma japonicum]|nr:Protein asteroid [Schistosoma japonicum]
MQTCREFLKHIKSHNLSPTDSSYYITLLPPLATVTLVQALDELKVDYVTTDGESDQDIISLGIYLQCPVISDDSDFYVTIPTTTAGICFLPLSFISFKPIINSINCNICQMHNKICAYLKCQKFLPNGPGFKYLPDVQRPLFASLLGNDYVSPCVFLKALPISQGKIINLNHNASKEMKIKRKSSIIVNLINWLSSFGVNTEEPIKRILDKYPKSERYKLSIELSQNISTVDHYGDDVNELCDKYILATDMSINSFKVTSYWPEELLNSFRKYLILPIFVDSILSHGLVSVCGVEALHDCHSIYSNSLYLRSLIYNLILGIECNVTFRFPNHLIGIEKSKSSSSYYITEFDRKGSFHIKRRKVFVHPMNLLENNEMNGKDHRLVFLQQYLGLEYDTLESDNNWLTSIVLINVLTYKSKCIPCTNDDITQCPISLTFGAICICAYLLIRHYNYSDLSYCKPLKKHFYNCAKYFTTQLNSTIQKSHLIKQNNTIQHHHTLKIHIVHVYAQLQIYYITISTLIHLLNSIVTNKDRNNLPTCLNVLPICSIFPSGYLFHEICYCTHLIQSENNEHQQYVRNVIIEKLMNYQNTNKNHLNDALNLFNCYLTLSSIQLCKSSFIKCSTNVKLVESNFADKSKQSHDSNNNNDKSSMENEMKQDEGSNMLPTKKIENITQTKKKVEKKRKQRKQHIKQPSYAEIEEKIAKLMLENDLFD